MGKEVLEIVTDPWVRELLGEFFRNPLALLSLGGVAAIFPFNELMKGWYIHRVEGRIGREFWLGQLFSLGPGAIWGIALARIFEISQETEIILAMMGLVPVLMNVIALKFVER